MVPVAAVVPDPLPRPVNRRGACRRVALWAGSYVLVGGVAEPAHDRAWLPERLSDQTLIGDDFGGAIGKQIDIRAPCLERGLLARCGDKRVMEADRRPVDLELLRACHRPCVTRLRRVVIGCISGDPPYIMVAMPKYDLPDSNEDRGNLIDFGEHLRRRIGRSAQGNDAPEPARTDWETFRQAENGDGARPRFNRHDLLWLGMILAIGCTFWTIARR